MQRLSNLFEMRNMVTAIILASGSGERFKKNIPKQFIKLAGMPVLAHSIKAFQTSLDFAEIVVVCHESFIDQVWHLVAQYSLSKVVKVVCGGETRQASSRIGIECCKNAEYVLIHDGVRPLVTERIIRDIVDSVKIHKAVNTVIPSVDTIVAVDPDGFIEEIPDRSFLRRVQTPQAFEYNLIKRAHEKAIIEGIEDATDDCSLVLRLGHSVYAIAGDEQNMKITYPLDLHIADRLIQLRNHSD